MNRQIKNLYAFGSFRFDVQERILTRDDQPIPLSPKVGELLLVLVENAGHLIEKDDLIKQVWPDTYVEDGNLNKNISILRKTLGQWDGREYIETVPKRGYRFIAAVNHREGEASPSPQARPRVTGTRLRGWILWQHPKQVTGLFLILILAVAAWPVVWHYLKPTNPDLPAIRSVAVLPLENLSGDSAQDYFADAMTDALITDLGQIGTLRVISRTSAMQYKAVHKALPQIARELNVDAIVEGSVVRAGDQVRITAQLIYAPADRHLWAQSYEGELRDVLRLQNEVASAITNQVRIKVTPEAHVTQPSTPTINPAAYEAYLKGFYSQRFNISGIQNSIAYFMQAIKQQPDFAAAYSGLAHAYIELGHMLYLPPGQAFPQAKKAALRALQLDDSLADAHEALATVLFLYDWNFPAAEQEFKRALALNPNAVYSHGGYADYLEAMGRFDESFAATKRLYAIDPLSPGSVTSLAADRYWARRYDEAVKPAREVLKTDPNSTSAHLWLGLVYEQKHEFGAAIVELKEANRLSNDKMFVGFVAHALAMSGDKAAARRILRDMRTQSQHSYVSPWWLATIYCGLGDKDQALLWLERAYNQREHDLVFLNLWPMFDILKPDPRYQDLLRRVGLPH